MKVSKAELHRHTGSSAGAGETGLLFPSLHANEVVNVRVRAPLCSKMALFDQFTVPYSSFLSSNKVATVEGPSKQQDTKEFLNTYTQSTVHAAFDPASNYNDGHVRIGNSSFSSSLDRLSTSSTVVNVEESQSSRGQEPEDGASPLFVSKSGMISRMAQSSNEKSQKESSQDTCAAKVVHSSPSPLDKGEAHEQAAVSGSSEGFHKRDKGLSTGDNLNSENCNIMERLYQEATDNNEGCASATCNQLLGSKISDSRLMKNNDATVFLQFKFPIGKNSKDRGASGTNGNSLEKPGTNSQGDMPCIASITSISPCEKLRSSLVSPLPAIIKPKDVIHVVGQQLFWKARKAILRQQEVFSNQVFQLHKLIEVQKLLAKMPSTLIERHSPASERVGSGFHPVKVSSKKREAPNKGAQQESPFNRHEGEVHVCRRQQLSLTLENSVVGVESQIKRESKSSHLPQVLMKGPFGHTSYPTPDGISAWGYPMGTIDASHFLSGSGFGRGYVMSPNPPMPLAPFTFSFYAPRPEQPAPIVCPTSQWPTPIFHNPFFTPSANDWFAMNHPNRVAFTSASERLGPANSVLSINMRVEASSQSVQPAVIPPLSGRLQVGESHDSGQVATKCFGSIATASVSTPQGAIPEKLDLGNMGEHNSMSNLDQVATKSFGSIATASVSTPQGAIPEKLDPGNMGEHNSMSNLDAFGGETKANVEVRGQSTDTRVQLPCCRSREDGIDSTACLLQKNALNLFPLEPLSRSGGGDSKGQVFKQGEGSYTGVIKAVPRPALAASESTAGILLSIQRERQL